MADSKYNGWSNYETWQANLWLGDDDADYMRESGDVTPEIVREYAEQALSDDRDELPGGLIGDIVNAWLSTVDWRELAEHYQADAE